MEKYNIKEIWMPVVGYEGHYEVSNLGRIKSIKLNTRAVDGIKKFNIWGAGGYYKVCLNKDGGQKTYTVHSIVAKAFLENNKNYNRIDHINGIPTDNRAINLRFCTHRENLSYPNVKRKTQKTSKYVGVCYARKIGRWQSILKHKNKFIFVGRFDTEEEAHEAYLLKLKELGE